jgi:hypothetical protein
MTTAKRIETYRNSHTGDRATLRYTYDRTSKVHMVRVDGLDDDPTPTVRRFASIHMAEAHLERTRTLLSELGYIGDETVR